MQRKEPRKEEQSWGSGETPSVFGCLHWGKTSPGEDQLLPLSYSLTVSCLPSCRGFSFPAPPHHPGLSLPDLYPPPFDISDFSTSSCAQVTLPTFSSCSQLSQPAYPDCRGEPRAGILLICLFIHPFIRQTY